MRGMSIEVGPADGLFRTLAEGATDGLVVTDTEGRVLYANPAACALLGVQPETIVGSLLGAPAIQAPVEMVVPSLHGMRHLEMRSGQGHLGGEAVYLAVLRDTTDQRRSEDALRQSEEKFTRVFRVSPDAMLLTRVSDGLILEANDAFYKTWGHEPSSVLRRTTLELQMWADPQERSLLVADLEADGRVRGRTLRFRSASGALFDGVYSGEVFMVGGGAAHPLHGP